LIEGDGTALPHLRKISARSQGLTDWFSVFCGFDVSSFVRSGVFVVASFGVLCLFGLVSCFG
jgi:hypothetical protein